MYLNRKIACLSLLVLTNVFCDELQLSEPSSPHLLLFSLMIVYHFDYTVSCYIGYFQRNFLGST